MLSLEDSPGEKAKAYLGELNYNTTDNFLYFYFGISVGSTVPKRSYYGFLGGRLMNDHISRRN